MTLRDVINYAQGIAVGGGTRLCATMYRDDQSGEREIRLTSSNAACCDAEFLVTHVRYYPDKHGGWSDWSACDLTAQDVLADDWQVHT